MTNKNFNQRSCIGIYNIVKSVLVLALLLPWVSSSPSASTKAVEADQFRRNVKLWGVVSNSPDVSKKRSFDLGVGKRPPKQIIIMGAPSSGKGTQCEYLKRKYGLVHISTGDLLRKAVSSGQNDSSLAPNILLRIKECMDSGDLIPDEIITQLVLRRLRSSECIEKGWILDGFPRTYAQAMALHDAGVQPEVFLFLNVPDEIAIQRVVGRRTDPVTGKSYHVKFNPPPNDEKLLRRLTVRSDDTIESMERRLNQFRHNVNAVKRLYTNVTKEIDGLGSPDDVSIKVDQALKELSRSLVRNIS